MNTCSDTQYPVLEEVCASRVVDADTVARVSAAISPDSLVERTAALFAALSDPTRFRLLDALSREDLCVGQLASIVGVSQSAVSHQLRLLRDRGLVASTRAGNHIVYRLADDHVRDLARIGLEHAAEGLAR